MPNYYKSKQYADRVFVFGFYDGNARSGRRKKAGIHVSQLQTGKTISFLSSTVVQIDASHVALSRRTIDSATSHIYQYHQA